MFLHTGAYFMHPASFHASGKFFSSDVTELNATLLFAHASSGTAVCDGGQKRVLRPPKIIKTQGPLPSVFCLWKKIVTFVPAAFQGIIFSVCCSRTFHLLSFGNCYSHWMYVRSLWWWRGFNPAFFGTFLKLRSDQRCLSSSFASTVGSRQSRMGAHVESSNRLRPIYCWSRNRLISGTLLWNVFCKVYRLTQKNKLMVSKTAGVLCEPVSYYRMPEELRLHSILSTCYILKNYVVIYLYKEGSCEVPLETNL
jgi:hypothetical protein